MAYHVSGVVCQVQADRKAARARGSPRFLALQKNGQVFLYFRLSDEFGSDFGLNDKSGPRLGLDSKHTGRARSGHLTWLERTV